MADVKTRRDKLSRFLEPFSNNLESAAVNLLPHRRIFWSQRPECDSSSLSSDDGDAGVIHNKIKSAFCDIHVDRLKGLIQFWAPVKSTTGGRRLLSTSDQPFVLEYLDGVFQKYRLCCMKYRYSIDDHVNDDNKLADEDDRFIISNGPVATAFLNQFPEAVLDLRVHRGTPLVDKALECGLTCLILLPVFDHQTSTSSCVGVVECCMKISGFLVYFDELRRALERVGLNTYHVQECLPYKTMHGLKHARDEIEEALKIVCESYQLSLAQVWIAKEIEKQKFVVKLCGYHVDDLKDGDAIKAYCDRCDVLPMKKGEGLPTFLLERTHYQLPFCNDVSKSRLKGCLGLLCRETKCGCLVMCLRSNHTGDNVDYAFELLWPNSRNFVIMLKSLVPTLRMCLPSFKFVSDALDERILRLVDSQTSQMPKPLEEEWQGPKYVKRRRLSGCENTQNNYSDNDDSEFWGYDYDIVVFAEHYTGKRASFPLRCSYMLENVKEKVEDSFNLEPETYRMEFESTAGEKVELNTDDELAHCIKLWRKAQHAGGAFYPLNSYFKVCVLQKE